MKKLLITLTLVAMVTSAFAWGGREINDGNRKWDAQDVPRMRMNEEDGQTCYEELDLTETQLEKLDKIRVNQQKDMIQFRSETQILNIDKREALQNKNFNKAKNIVKDIYNKKQEQAIKRIEYQEERWNLLTPEQQEKAKELMFNHRSQHHKNPRIQKPAKMKYTGK
ncbi:MAG: Spy/CpxP family protein refolding chaperone [Candidatus Cloacimonadota bacterium]|nr:Spy/CpxP family protein refolding chaperone [Candidatus Cloacimonadota bacterium]